MRDSREHRKQSFHLALAGQDWQEVVTADNVDLAVRIMEGKICSLMDKCMPLRSIRKSSRDPTVDRCPLSCGVCLGQNRESCLIIVID